ncbi:Cell cycle control protein 50A [Armadillidium nasatum]|uniref:Cell cycle control protein 50A n=1 Tax=Armadillidium nasatum TaxID=96803 RepID=A0A5N5STR2_9CRUS|nr:Cell cycle control protein 50A [Armadillidium nasatum]
MALYDINKFTIKFYTMKFKHFNAFINVVQDYYGDSKFKQKFKQQKLPAWQPILTADTVLPAFFLIGLLFIPLGVALLYFSNNVQEKSIDYTTCQSVDGHFRGIPCQDVLENNRNSSVPIICNCIVNFTLEKAFEKNNFYQNHRRYVKSRDDNQLLGKSITDVDAACDPFDHPDDTTNRLYAPCGAIANSLFNDTLVIHDIKHDYEVGVLNTEIAWPSDKRRKFKNPKGNLNDTGPDAAFNGTVKPLYWSKPVFELDPKNPSNNGYENEDLIVWMRTAAFPSFRKLYRRIDHTKEGYKNGLPQGQYSLHVQYNYPVKSFGGSKHFIISTTSFLGGKNDFLGIAYITVGAICLLLGVIFLIVHIKFGKRPSDLQNITQNTPFSD